MRRYCMNSSCLADVSEQEILFYTETNPPGIISTALWKYRIGSKELERCFQLQECLHFWKYPAREGDTGLQYIGLRYPGRAYVTGFDAQGQELFRVEPGKQVDMCGPVFDTAGNIYLSVDDQWIFCLNSAGEQLWKWKSVYAIPGVSTIEKYWVFQDRLYIIACGQLYAISLSGHEEESYTIYEFPYKPIQCKVFEDRILFIGLKYRELLCYNLKGEKLWQFSAAQGENILRIAACKNSRIYLEAFRSEGHCQVLYVLDERGEKCWDLCEDWSELHLTAAQEVILLKHKSISIYSSEGQKILQNTGKKEIIFANVFADRLVMIGESKGKIAVLEQDREMREKPHISRLPDIKEELETAENTVSWQKEIMELVSRNLDLFVRYFQVELLEIRISCELFSRMNVSVRTDGDTWKSAMAEDIPCEEIAEEDRDSYKECCYGNDCIWTEFCDACSEEEVEGIMNSVCDLVSRKYGVEAKLIFR